MSTLGDAAPPATGERPQAATVADRIAAFAASLRFDELPPDVVEKAKVALLHNLTVALAGHRLAELPLRLASETGAAAAGPGARLLVARARVDLRSAAFANALLITARAQDDVHLPAFSHIGCIVTPAALAVAEDLDAGGRDLLSALIAGYETAAAIGDGLAARSAARGFRPVLYSQVGAAVACSLLLGASRETIVHAIGLAVGFGGGTSQTWIAGTQEWLYQSGVASQNGLLAAQLAHRGATGARDSLEGEAGLYATFGGSREGTEGVGLDLGDNWRIRGVTFKPYPVCTLNQVPVSALIALARERGIRAESVRRIAVTMNGAEARYPGTDVKGPFADFGAAMMSVQYCLAVALRETTVETSHLLAFDDEALLSLVQRIDVEIDDALPPRSCRLAVRTSECDDHATEFVSTAETFNWDRDRAAELARDLRPETRLGRGQMDALVSAVLDAERHPARRLVDYCAAA